VKNEGVLRAVGIRRTYGDNVVLDGVSLEVARGQITAVIGPSGSGKTTLIRALALVDIPEGGEIWLDADLIFSYDKSEGLIFKPPWPRVTIVFQQLFLWPHLTLRENILLPIRRRSSVRAQDTFADLLERLNMNHFIDRYPAEASLGERQRAALVRALLLEPDFILLDEITSALDVEHINEVLSLLELLRTRNVGVVIVTHLIEFARGAAEKIVFLDNGAVVERGSADILTQPRTSRLREFLQVVRRAR